LRQSPVWPIRRSLPYNVAMRGRAGHALLTILRIAAGAALAVMAVPLLIQGGFSRYAKYGTPAHADWRYLGLAVVMLGVGLFLIRPYWWKSLGTRHR
jgi:hypothetical protein